MNRHKMSVNSVTLVMWILAWSRCSWSLCTYYLCSHCMYVTCTNDRFSHRPLKKQLLQQSQALTLLQYLAHRFMCPTPYKFFRKLDHAPCLYSRQLPNTVLIRPRLESKKAATWRRCWWFMVPWVWVHAFFICVYHWTMCGHVRAVHCICSISSSQLDTKIPDFDMRAPLRNAPIPLMDGVVTSVIITDASWLPCSSHSGLSLCTCHS